MRGRVAFVAAMLWACTPEVRSPATTSEPPVVVAPRASAVAAEPVREPPPAKPPRPSFGAYPTVATAGAASCKILPPVLLGPRAEGDTVVGFGAQGGIATWKRDPTALAVQPLGADGATVGDSKSVAVDQGIEPAHVFAVDRGFVVLLLRWDLKNHDVSWWAVLHERGGRAHPPVDIGLANMDVRVGQALDGRRIGLIVSAAIIARQKPPGRWQTLTVADNGHITSAASAVDTSDLVTTTGDVWERAEIAGKRGWLVVRDGVRRAEGVFDGVRLAASRATLLRPSDGLVAEVHNAARPPPRGPGGRIFEAMGRPTLVRVHNGKEIGRSLPLEWHGNPVGAIAMNIESSLSWSGSHFIYPFRNRRGANLLPIDCRP